LFIGTVPSVDGTDDDKLISADWLFLIGCQTGGLSEDLCGEEVKKQRFYGISSMNFCFVSSRLKEGRAR